MMKIVWPSKVIVKSGFAIFATMLALAWDTAVLIKNPIPGWVDGSYDGSYGSFEFLQSYESEGVSGPTILNVWLAELATVFSKIIPFWLNVLKIIGVLQLCLSTRLLRQHDLAVVV